MFGKEKLKFRIVLMVATAAVVAQVLVTYLAITREAALVLGVALVIGVTAGVWVIRRGIDKGTGRR